MDQTLNLTLILQDEKIPVPRTEYNFQREYRKDYPIANDYSVLRIARKCSHIIKINPIIITIIHY